MAAFTLSPATSSQYRSSNNGLFSPTKSLVRSEMAGRERVMKVTCQTASFPAGSVPVMDRRKIMNLLLFGAVGLPAATGLLIPYSNFFSQPCSASSKGSTIAKDEFGNDVIASEWLKTNGPDDRTLTQGLKGDPTYLMVNNNKTFATYGINAVCTHLGCIVPWNTVQKKFICPCHDSQYNNEGKVIKGPAPKSLELAHVDIDNGKVVFASWTETDFRTGDAPWWS